MQLSTVAMVASVLAATTQGIPFHPAPPTLLYLHEETLTVRDATAWTIENARRSCNDKDMECEWSFAINTHQEGLAPTPCKFITHSFDGNPASQSPQFGADCGPYRIQSGWSGQFGAGHGFTTLSVLDEVYRLVAFPAYTDKQLEGGEVVQPNLSFAPHAF